MFEHLIIYKDKNMKNFSIILSTVAVILAAVSLVCSIKCRASASDVSPEAVAAALKSNPIMVVDALQAYQTQQQEEQRKAAEEAFKKNLPEINSSEHAPFVGPEDAKVTVVEFFDFSCHYCKRLAPELEKVMANNADVKFVFKPLAFVDPANSSYQAQASLAVFKQGKFPEFYKAVMEANGRLNKDAIDNIVKGLGVDFDQYKSDIDSDEVKNDLADISNLANKVNINGVPAVIIDGKHVQTMSAEDLQEAIDAAK